MDFCTAHFGKALKNLKVDDLRTYFQQPRTETDQIEFKSIPAGPIIEKFPSIQKSVCAFLNSSGGVLIWGAPEEKRQAGKKEKVAQGELTFSSEKLEKDWIISKISDSIIPLPNGLRINILLEDNKSVVVLEIDPSEYSPHQTNNSYFMRIDGQSKHAPHHYIEALFKKITFPNIEAYLKITNLKTSQDAHIVKFSLFFFNWSPLQNEENLGFTAFCNGVFQLYRQNPVNPNFSHAGSQFIQNNVEEIFSYGTPYVSRFAIIFDTEVLVRHNGVCNLTISFGGKYSPNKISMFNLDFTKIHPKHFGRILVAKQQNRMPKDLEDTKGITKNNVIEAFMAKN